LGKWLWRYATEREALGRMVVSIKYESMKGDRRSKQVGGPYGVGVWECIRGAWGGFANYLRYEVGDGSRALFWYDVWCGEQSLKVSFPELFTFACGKDTWVEDNMQLQNGSIHWSIIFARPVHNWEVEVVSGFLEMLYSQGVKHGGKYNLLDSI
jgi:hypothetical protein